MTALAIQVKNTSVFFKTRKGFFRFNKHHALSDISFDLKRGETLGIIGRNGCGKSTLLKVLANIFQPDRGEVKCFVNNVSLQTLSAGFDKELSGRDNAILAAMLLGHNKIEAKAGLDDIQQFSELGAAFNEPVKTYSSGMKARLGFSVAIRMHADVLLVDEVLGVGDSRFKRKAEAAILDKMNSDQTVVFVSHSSAQVKRLCDRVVWLEQGKVVKVGASSDIVDEYEVFMKDIKLIKRGAA